MEKGTITISKMNAAESFVVVKIRLSDRYVKAQMSFDDFAQTVLGMSDVPCDIETRIGKFHGIKKTNIRE